MTPLSYPLMEGQGLNEDEFMSVDLSLAKLRIGEPSYNPAAPTQIQHHNGRRRFVRLNLGNVRVINPATEYYTDEDMDARWLTGEDLCNMKTEAKRLSSVIRRVTKERGSCIVSIAHRKTSLMMKSDFKALVKLSPSAPDQDLVHWCNYTDGRRGLERFASGDYNVIRSSDVIKTRTIVLEEQERQRNNCVCPDDEAIAKCARESSQRARTFARFLGVADFAAARAQYEIEKRRAPARAYTAVGSPTNTKNTTMMHQIIPSPLIQRSQHASREEAARQAPPRKKSKIEFQPEIFHYNCS